MKSPRFGRALRYDSASSLAVPWRRRCRVRWWSRDKIGRVVLAVLVPLTAAIIWAVSCAPHDGYVSECHAAGGRVLRRGFTRFCIGPVGFIPLDDAY
jgi:hypothetical protein